jgi:thiol-disulfide isomerase/thioredoxin
MKMIWATLFGILLSGCGIFEENNHILKIGAPIPLMQFIHIDGGEFRLDNTSGKITIINVWAPWCLPCREEMPSLERLSHLLDQNQGQIIGVAMDERPQVQEFIQRFNITFPIVLEHSDYPIEGFLGVKQLPETLIVAPNGTLAARIVGYQEWDSAEMKQRLQKIDPLIVFDKQ